MINKKDNNKDNSDVNNGANSGASGEANNEAINKNDSKIKDDWFLLEEIPSSSVFLLSGTFRRMTEEFRSNYDIGIHMNMLYKDHSLYLYFKHSELLSTGKVFFNKTMDDFDFLNSINLKNKKAQKDMFNFSAKLASIDVNTLNDKKLILLYDKLALLFEKAIVAGWVDNVMEFENELFSSYLRGYLEDKNTSQELSTADIFSIFTTPNESTYGGKQDIAIQKIAKKILANSKVKELFNESVDEINKLLPKVDIEINKCIESHTKEYTWYFYMYEGPGWGRDDFIKQLKGIIEDGISLNDINIKNKKSELIKKLDIDKKHEKLFDLASELVYNKDLRKHSIYYSCYMSSQLFEEIAKRLNLTIQQVRTILPWEMNDFLSNGVDKKILVDRENGFLMQFYDGKTVISKPKDSMKFFNKVKTKQNVDLSVNSLTGSCAFSGIVEGKVKIVNLPSEINKIQKGDILVSHQTNPDLLVAMKLAGAFVTDIGGITCHAAVVSREMRKPCIVGTKFATKVFKDGDVVRVDAQKGIIKKIK